jgi:DNA repair exonuclease SbcCD ATPase subunit
MQRELNPELFGEGKSARTARTEATPGAAVAPTGAPETTTFLNLDRQVLEMRQLLATLGEELRKVAAQSQEFMKTSHLKLERLQQQVMRLEQSHNGMAQEAGQKFHMLSQRMGERKALDQKIQDMVDRHTQVIKSFEVRMSHLQRLLTEKEAQFMNAQTALNEMKMELSRLKRL